MRKLSMLILFFSILSLSCQKEKATAPIESKQVNREDPQIAAARNYFNNVVLKETTVVGSLDARQTLKKTADWDKAYISITAKQDVVAVPLKFDRPMSFKTKTGEFQLKDQSKLLIFKGADGKLKAEVVTYIPDQGNSPDQFNGIVITEDWAGNRINRYIYQKGKAYRLVDNRANNLNGADAQCMKIDWYLCDVDESGHTSNCVYMYSEYIGSCNQGLEPPGESGTEEYIEIERRRRMAWKVAGGPGYEVDAWDALKGRNGVFTGIIADGSQINWTAPWRYRQDKHEGAFSGPAATANVEGYLINYDTGQDYYQIRGSNTWYYSEVF